MTWRVKRKCDDCPFSVSGAGLRLRKSLGRGRWNEILASLRIDSGFPCHKTTVFDEEGDAVQGTGLQCAGALAWQRKHNGCVGQLARIMERLDYARKL